MNPVTKPTSDAFERNRLTRRELLAGMGALLLVVTWPTWLEGRLETGSGFAAYGDVGSILWPVDHFNRCSNLRASSARKLRERADRVDSGR